MSKYLFMLILLFSPGVMGAQKTAPLGEAMDSCLSGMMQLWSVVDRENPPEKSIEVKDEPVGVLVKYPDGRKIHLTLSPKIQGDEPFTVITRDVTGKTDPPQNFSTQRIRNYVYFLAGEKDSTALRTPLLAGKDILSIAAGPAPGKKGEPWQFHINANWSLVRTYSVPEGLGPPNGIPLAGSSRFKIIPDGTQDPKSFYPAYLAEKNSCVLVKDHPSRAALGDIPMVQVRQGKLPALPKNVSPEKIAGQQAAGRPHPCYSGLQEGFQAITREISTGLRDELEKSKQEPEAKARFAETICARYLPVVDSEKAKSTDVKSDEGRKTCRGLFYDQLLSLRKSCDYSAHFNSTEFNVLAKQLKELFPVPTGSVPETGSGTVVPGK